MYSRIFYRVKWDYVLKKLQYIIDVNVLKKLRYSELRNFFSLSFNTEVNYLY